MNRVSLVTDEMMNLVREQLITAPPKTKKQILDTMVDQDITITGYQLNAVIHKLESRGDRIISTPTDRVEGMRGKPPHTYHIAS